MHGLDPCISAGGQGGVQISRGFGLNLLDPPILTAILVTGKHMTKLHVCTAGKNPVIPIVFKVSLLQPSLCPLISCYCL